MKSSNLLWRVLVSSMLGVVIACTPSTDAAGFVSRYLAAASQPVGDRGWAMLHPTTQREMFDGQVDVYLVLAAASDWSGFEWDVLDSFADDPSLHVVGLTLERGSGSIPALLRENRNNFFLVAVPPDQPADASASAEMMVRLGPDGTGIWAAGG